MFPPYFFNFLCFPSRESLCCEYPVTNTCTVLQLLLSFANYVHIYQNHILLRDFLTKPIMLNLDQQVSFKCVCFKHKSGAILTLKTPLYLPHQI